MASDEAVANEPRLFVGQIPAKCTEEDLWPLFSPYVLYTRWAQAEAAAEALDGNAALTGGAGRPLVVHFANPRRPPPGLPAEPGLAPKKLFVGQVPRDVTEEMLKPLFAPYGEIEHINILRTQRGLSSGCGFVQFKRWSQAENAMEAHNGKTRLGSSDVPLVVKFADAKRREQQMPGLDTAYQRSYGWGDPTKLVDSAADFPYQLPQQQWDLMNQGNPMLGGMGPLAVQQQVQSLMATAYPGNYPLSQYPLLADQGMLQRGMHGYSHTGSEVQQLGPDIDQLAGRILSNPSHQLASTIGLASQAGSDSLGSLPAGSSSADMVAQQLSKLNIGLGSSQRPTAEAIPGPTYVPQAAALPDLGASLASQQPAMGLPGARRIDMQSAYLQGMAGTGGSFPYGGLLPGLGLPGSEHASRPWGQRITSNDRLNEWKLFIGQVPLEASEESLFALFSPIGQILELYILRNNNAKSRGCAFVTYATKQLAEQAITQLNGRQMPSGKTLVVKFADRASAGKSSGVDPLLLHKLYQPR